MSISATARVTVHSRDTIARWLERASTAAQCFNQRMLHDFDIQELQADELCTFVGSKRSTLWLFATLEVCSRLWASSVLGRRSYSAERSCRAGRAAREDRLGESAEGRALGVGGFRNPEHLVRRAPQPHDSPRLGVLAPSLALPRSGRRPAPRARRALAVLLQFHPTAQGVCGSVERPGRQRCRPVW